MRHRSAVLAVTLLVVGPDLSGDDERVRDRGRVPLLLAQLVLGLSLLRGQWLTRWAVGRPAAVAGGRLQGAVQQPDADERRGVS